MKQVYFFLLFSLLLQVNHTVAQEILPKIKFEKTDKQRMPFNAVPDSKWRDKFPWVANKDGERRHVPVKTLAEGQQDWVSASLSDTLNFDWSQIEFFYGKKRLLPQIVSASKVILSIENPEVSYEIGAYFKKRPVGKLRTTVLQKKKRKVVIVPLVASQMNQTFIEKQLNKIYEQANTEWTMRIESPFIHPLFNHKTVFGAPSGSFQFTGQMRLLRDKYFDKNRMVDEEAYYIFVIPAFSDSSKIGFTIPYKSMGFVPYNQNETQFSIQLARVLAQGIGGLDNSWVNVPESGSSNNLMDTTSGTDLLFFQLEKLQNPDYFFSTRDGFELVKTSNGTVCYLFWEEDKKGNIKWDGKSVVRSLKRPFKKNFLAYRFDVKFAVLRPFYRLGPYYISILNFIFVGIILWLIFFLRRKFKSIWSKTRWKRYLRRPFFWMKLLAGIYLIYLSFSWGNSILDQFKLLTGPMPELNGFTYEKVKKNLFSNVQFRKESEYGVSSEILIQKKGKWSFKQAKSVIYLEVVEEKNGQKKLKYRTSSDYLILRTKDYKERVYNHYIVVSMRDVSGKFLEQEVYNYSGEKLDQLEDHPNVPKRVLVFVNGYRPTSNGRNFNEAFQDIVSAGLEFPNSTNFVYNFDRYEYWEPWGEINLQFQNKINPSVTLYADGHFSVSTSNYRSLLNFSRVAHIYPKRCDNPKKHVCQKVKNDDFLKFISPTKKTENLIDRFANKKGFDYRKAKGQIAGMNVLQELNRYPGMSKNDTLFIVAHSMGFAYSLGMIDVLRGEINFGGFYIVAPENAKSGEIIKEEWKEIWQYGSNFKLSDEDAPCLQDGVAPQSGVAGLPMDKRVFIPENLYNRKGFFDSHFIGYYDWILKLEKRDKGFIKQR